MLQFYNYSLYFFDCDGVILDSNSIKVDAMRSSLESCDFIKGGVQNSLNYFSSNFGKSRFHHVKEFLNRFLIIDNEVDLSFVEQIVLDNYACILEEAYFRASVLQNIEAILNAVKAPKYVVSGSEQSQLERVLVAKGLSGYFEGIYGSPLQKIEIIKNILASGFDRGSALMIGDSVADLEAAKANGIDFLGVSGFSNTPTGLIEKCDGLGYRTIKNWDEVLNVQI